MLSINPEFKKLIPPLTADEFQQLEANCLAEGIRDAIVVWNGYILDGHNRYEIANKHGLQYRTVEKHFESIYDAKDWMFVNQLGRRNLNELQISKLRGDRYNNQKQQHGGDRKSSGHFGHSAKTAEAMAKEYNVGENTIKRDADFATGLEHVTPELEQDILQGNVKVNKGDVQELAKAEPFFVATTKDELIKKANEIRKQKQEEKQSIVAAERKAKEAAGRLITDLDIDFRLGDFETVFSDIPDGSIDCIITDPPYPKEFLECWTKLARFAKRVLKPNGFCIAYSGHIYLDNVMSRMCEHLDYYWIFSMYQPGATQIVHPRSIMAAWKPILIYQNGLSKNNKVIRDYFISEQREKTGHDWQQSLSGVNYLIEMFTNEGDLICEPFAGSGTTIVAAKQMNRKVIASEIDETTYNIAKSNL